MQRIVIGIAGGTGAGKTTLANEVASSLNADEAVVIEHDRYYRDRNDLPPEERVHINYDHPHSLETELLVQHLRQLLQGQPVVIPIYDFNTHTRRRAANKKVYPKKVIILEGIFSLVDSSLRELMDIKVFVDTDPDIRLIRRMRRDMMERGRTMDSVIRQYLKTVRPMHFKYVEPTKQHAEIIVCGCSYAEESRAKLISRVQILLQNLR